MMQKRAGSKLNLKTTGVSVAAFCASWSLPAAAQNSDQIEELQNREIVVTAQKRAENIIDVPIAITAYTSEALERSRVSNLESLQSISPSLSIKQSASPSSASFNIRGIGTSLTAAGGGLEQSVGVYIDGVLRGRPGAALQDIIDLERIEVLRGPQSTVFGRNNTAGSINIATKAPEFDWGGSIRGSYGSRDLIQVQASVTGPLVDDSVAIRVSGGVNKQDGFVKNTIGRDVNATDRKSVRAQLLFKFGENGSFRLIGDYSEADDTCCGRLLIFVGDRDRASTPLPGGAILTGPQVGVTLDNASVRGSVNGQTGTFVDVFTRSFATSTVPSERSKDWGLSGELQYGLGAIDWTTIAGYRKYDSDQLFDADAGNGFSNVVADFTYVNREFSFESRLTNANSGNLDWLVGVYYYNQKIDNRNNIRTDFNLPIAFSPGPPPRVTLTPNGVKNVYDGDAYAKNESIAGFGQVTWNLSEKFSATGGLRYLSESSRINIVTRDAVNSAGSPAPGITIFALGGLPSQSGSPPKQSDNALMGAASIEYKPSPYANIYMRYAHGYKSGGFDLVPLSRTVNNLGFRPETSDAFELGAKFRTSDGKFRANLAVFHQQVDDQQVQTLSALGTATTTNAAKLTSKGIELDLTARPSRRWEFTAGITYLDARYDSFQNATAPIFITGSQDLSGRRPLFAPVWTLTTGVQYSLPVGTSGWQLRVRPDVQLKSDYYTTLQLDELFRNNDTLVMGLGASIVSPNDRYSAQLWVKNLTEENIILGGTQAVLSNASAAVNVNEPRTWGITLSGRF